MRYSSLSPSHKVLDLLDIPYPEEYAKIMTHPRHADFLNVLSMKTRYTPLFIKSISKGVQQIGLDGYNDKLLDAMNKASLDRRDKWYAMQVYLYFYGYTKEAKNINKITNKLPELKGSLEYVDLLHYLFVHSKYSLSYNKRIKFPKMDLFFSSETLLSNTSMGRKYGNLAKALELLSNNYSISEFLFINSIMREIDFPLFSDDKKAHSTLYNGAVYQMIIAYNFGLTRKIYIATAEDSTIKKDVRVTEFINGEYLDFFNNYINVRKTFGNDEELDVNSYSKKLNTAISIFEVLLNSDFKSSEWDAYLSLPFEWLKAIASDK